jgi:2-keto-4-pentenoate hydratase/2-oxohepta-3-ene-1,7-dioic acid hydratase in catechol pathway
VIHLVRYASGTDARWGVVQNERVTPLEGRYATTRELIESGEEDYTRSAQRTHGTTHALTELSLLSPVTAPCRVICQGLNYRAHMIESGLDPDVRTFNLFFEKSDASVTGPHASVRRPRHVRLLDYEVELALVFRKAITHEVVVSPENLHEYVFGYAIANDLSARDVQLPQGQFFKGKSYRGFCPIGPFIAVPGADTHEVLDHLELSLEVNGEPRQRDRTANMLYKPAETISELSTFSDIAPGDVLLTGTPSGCVARSPHPLVRRLASALLPEKALWASFVRTQAKRPYLRPGDLVTARIRSDDGRVDLGEQRIRVVDAGTDQGKGGR